MERNKFLVSILSAWVLIAVTTSAIDLTGLENEVDELQAQQKITEEEIERIVNKNENQDGKIKKNKSNIETSNEEIEVLKQQLNQTQQENEHLEAELKKVQNEIKVMNESLVDQAFEPEDCLAIYETNPSLRDGVYRIYPLGSANPSFLVYCDLKNAGYTVIQKRFDGTVSFVQTFNDYVIGFGYVSSEHWLGLEKINMMTKNNLVELHIDLEDWDGTTKFAHYGMFRIGGFKDYSVHFDQFSGDAGDSLKYDSTDFHQSKPFGAYDRDVGDCSSSSGGSGGWWYANCARCNLNGGDYRSPTYYGIRWDAWKGQGGPSLKASTMKIRRKKTV